jgi:hypothetical protein
MSVRIALVALLAFGSIATAENIQKWRTTDGPFMPTGTSSDSSATG